MPLRDRPYHFLLGLSVALFLVASVGFGVIARVTVGEEAFSYAISQHLYYAAVQPVGTLFLFLPFVFLGWMSASLAKRRSLKHGLMLFLFGGLLLCFLYFDGYRGAQIAVTQHKWTTAALSEGLLPFLSIPVLVVCGVVRLFAGRRKDVAET